MKDSPFDDSPPDALGALQSLAMQTEAEDDPVESNKILAVAGLAMLGAAALLGLFGWWLLQGGIAAHAATPTSHGHRRSDFNISDLMVLAGAGALFATAVLVIFALISFSKIAMRKMAN